MILLVGLLGMEKLVAFLEVALLSGNGRISLPPKASSAGHLGKYRRYNREPHTLSNALFLASTISVFNSPANDMGSRNCRSPLVEVEGGAGLVRLCFGLGLAVGL